MTRRLRSQVVLLSAWLLLVLAGTLAESFVGSPAPGAGLIVLAMVPVLLVRDRRWTAFAAAVSAALLVAPMLTRGAAAATLVEMLSRGVAVLVVLALWLVARSYERISERLRRAVATQRALVDGASALVWLGTPQRGERRGSDRSPKLVGRLGAEWEVFTGQRRSEAAGAGWLSCVHEADRERLREAWQQPDPEAWPERYDDTVRLWHATSRDYRYMDVRLRPVRVNDEVVGWLGTFVDAHARRVALHAHAQGDERLREAQQIARLGLWEYDPASDRIMISSELSQAFGGEPAPDVITLDEVLSYLPGTPADHIDGLLAAMVAGGNGADGEYPLLLPDGVRRIARLVVRPGRGSDGQPIVWGIGQDVTERVRAREREQALEARLGQAMKMQTVGELSTGLAHDFNNVLTSLLGYGELAARRAPAGDDELRGYLTRLLDAGRRGRDLLRTLLRVGRGAAAAGAPEPDCPIGEVVTEAVNLVRVAMPRGILFVERIDTEVRGCFSRQGLQEAVVNLCVNARDALQGSGTIHVEVHAGIAGGTCAVCAEALRDAAVFVDIADDGTGIDAEVLPRIFEPFFSTKLAGEGTGLGLAMVARLLHAEGGHVLVDSRPGATRFRLVIPDQPRQVTTLLPAAPPNVAEFASGDVARYRVLVLDDEAPIGRLIGSAFEQSGVAASVFVDAREAQAAFAAAPERFDLIVTDLTMPMMSGIEFASALRRQRRVPTLLVTGGGTPDEELYATGAFDQVLRKPFTMRELLTTALHMLQSRGAAPSREPVH